MDPLWDKALEERNNADLPQGWSVVQICPIFDPDMFMYPRGRDRFGFDAFTNTVWVVDMSVMRRWNPEKFPLSVKAMIREEAWTKSEDRFIGKYLVKVRLISAGMIMNPDPATKQVAVILNGGKIQPSSAVGILVDTTPQTMEERERLIENTQIKEGQKSNKFMEKVFGDFL